MTINKARAIISLLFAIMLFFTTIFIGYFVNENQAVSDGLKEAKQHARESEEEYLESKIYEQEILIDTVEKIWEDQLKDFPRLPFSMRTHYLSSSLDRLLIPAYENLIIAFYKDGELIYSGYRTEKYRRVLDRVLTLDPNHLQNTLVLNEHDERFGEGERVFVSNTTLKDGNDEVVVYVMFEETVVYESMIKGLNTEKINSLIERGQIINHSLYAFLIFILFMGIIILISLRKMYVDVRYSNCPYYGNKICGAYYDDITNTKEVDLDEDSKDIKS